MSQDTDADRVIDAASTPDEAAAPSSDTDAVETLTPSGEVMDYVALTPEQKAARDRRNRAIAFGLLAFIVLIFLTTVIRLSSNYNTGG